MGMSAWDASATCQAGGAAGAPTVVNVSLQAGASFHLRQPSGAATSWAVEQVPMVAAGPPSAYARAALPDSAGSGQFLRWGSRLGAV
eukprot:2707203-Alexandrium_andersonii.AAC.1